MEDIYDLINLKAIQGHSRKIQYKFNTEELAPYIYDFLTGKADATNATVYEESDTAETLYKNRHDVNNPYISIPLPSLWN